MCLVISGLSSLIMFNFQFVQYFTCTAVKSDDFQAPFMLGRKLEVKCFNLYSFSKILFNSIFFPNFASDCIVMFSH